MSPPVYAADPPEARRVAPLDGLTLVFHRPSGATHVVVTPVPELLDLLAARPGDAKDVLARLGESYELAGEDDLLDVIVERLAELEVSGLVFRM